MINFLTQADVIWPFDSSPYYPIRVVGASFTDYCKIDPFPCYSFDKRLAEDYIAKVETAFPIGVECSYNILSHEVTDRTNGFAASREDWNYEKEPYKLVKIYPYIVFSGKRTPIHTSMQKYLIGHERGHIIEDWLRLSLSQTEEEFRKAYAKRRGIPYDLNYGGSRWDTNVGEVIANDFRILVAGVEVNYWPHPNFVHPQDCKDIQAFWDEMTDYENKQV